ncbi:MAG: sulfur carrier protein ThiS [Parvibaculaceae bacterium]|nr:sulfur carrier protein ThiS [Parvibaculaceae bacterium]
MAIEIRLNGETASFEAPLTVLDLLARLELTPGKVAVERNLEIVPRSSYGETPVEQGDRFEIVHFVGGG